MRVLIVEDEYSVAQNLHDILLEIDPSIEVMAILETVKDTVAWIAQNDSPDLGFFDIQIADGNSFEIFEKTTVHFPIVFTTAFNEFALKAFKVNSIDYLMKPIKKSELNASLVKYNTIYNKQDLVDNNKLLQVIQELRNEKLKKYKKSFLVYIRDKIVPITTQDIAYFYVDHEMVYCTTFKNEKYRIDQALDRIQNQLNPDAFFRASRQYLVSRKAVVSASAHFHRKLTLTVAPASATEIIISKLKITEFKNWLAGI